MLALELKQCFGCKQETQVLAVQLCQWSKLEPQTLRASRLQRRHKISIRTLEVMLLSRPLQTTNYRACHSKSHLLAILISTLPVQAFDAVIHICLPRLTTTEIFCPMQLVTSCTSTAVGLECSTCMIGSLREVHLENVSISKVCISLTLYLKYFSGDLVNVISL